VLNTFFGGSFRPCCGGAIRRLCRLTLRFRGILKSLCIVATLTGCAVGPDFLLPDPPRVTGYLPKGRGAGDSGKLVAGQRVVSGADIPGRWWELLRSRHLNQLIEQGIIYNADLAAAEAAVRVAQANALAQRGALFPTVAANFNPTRQQVAGGTVTSPLVSNATLFNLHTAQVTVSYVADVFGGTRRLIEAADAQTELQAFQRESVYLTLTANIALAAIQEASLRGQIAATQRLIEIQLELLDLLRRQSEQGQIALPDVVLQETAVAQARLLLAPLQKALGQQRNLLAVLTGHFPSEAMAASFELASFRLPRRVPLSLPADLVRQRPDIRAAEANLHAANAQIGVAIANRLPQFTITGNAGSTATAIGQLFAPGNNFWMLAGNIAQTVFDAGTLENKQRAAEAAYDQITAQYRSTMLVAFQNVADALWASQSDARALAAAIEAERTASRSIDLVRRQVEQGQVSLPTLLSAQQAYLQTSLARVQAEATRLADTVVLFQALGGGWWNRTEPVALLPREKPLL